MTELIRNGPMYLHGDFPASFPPTEWEADGATFDVNNHCFSWADAEGWLFHQGAIPFEAGNAYLLRFNATLNGSTIYPSLGGNAGPEMSASGEYAAVIVAGSGSPGQLSFHERAGSSAAGDSAITMVSLREVAMVPVDIGLLPG